MCTVSLSQRPNSPKFGKKIPRKTGSSQIFGGGGCSPPSPPARTPMALPASFLYNFSFSNFPLVLKKLFINTENVLLICLKYSITTKELTNCFCILIAWYFSTKKWCLLPLFVKMDAHFALVLNETFHGWEVVGEFHFKKQQLRCYKNKKTAEKLCCSLYLCCTMI